MSKAAGNDGVTVGQPNGLNITSVGGERVTDSTPIGGINPAPNVVNIPVPGALPLRVAGLIAMGAVGRRRKA